ncbi:MAG: hypothetical protein QF471_09070 [Phycisphaerales bacterium]|jgi:hypothetical protein|nr:hypothetical protein [Phycisphaerales bacterium]
MSQHDTTHVPGTTRGGLIGWVVGLLVLVAGMMVAGFVLNAGQVWVVPETQSYRMLEHVDQIDIWVPEDSQKARSLDAQGVPLTQSVVRTLPAESLKLAGGDKMITPATKLMSSHFVGVLITDDWQKADASGLFEAAPSGWKVTDQTSEWETVTQLPANTKLGDRPEAAVLSWNRTIGVWLAAILTLCIMSFLIGDNPFYKTAEALVVGASAAYAMVYSFYTGIVDQLLVNLWPGLVRGWTTPGLAADWEWKWIYIIPLILSIMLVCRLLPKGGWIARWPLAFIIGATAGFRLLAHLESDFLLQIKGTIKPLWALDTADAFIFWPSMSAIVILLSVLACLVYFFFSMEHKGLVGKTARGGILVLMVTFGAAFGLTVMGRITLLTERFDFLFKDWLHLL